MATPLELLGMTFLAGVALATFAPTAQAQGVTQKIQPSFSLWDAKPGMALADVPEADIVATACGTNGGPPSTALRHLADYMQCPPEASGLREIHFAYDDEQDYIARAFDLEYDVVQGGTSIYAYHIIASMLVDDAGIIQGVRAVTDPNVSPEQRRKSVDLRINLKSRFGAWGLACTDIAPRPGEQPVGRTFIHETCTGRDAATGEQVRIESSYLRKPGQQGLNRETQQVNTGYFESQVRFELVNAPYEPASGPS